MAAEPAIRVTSIGPPTTRSLVPAAAAQDRFLAPQAISAVDISADGKVITVGTMAFSHEPNMWQFSADGAILARRHFPPWAPMQVSTLTGSQAMGIGMAYSRVTSPDPTVWLGPTSELLSGALPDSLAENDSSDAQLARWRPGDGDWRTGWLASSIGELFARGPDWIFKPPGLLLNARGERQRLRFEDKNQLPTSRATRMAASADGRRLAFGWLGLAQDLRGVPIHRDSISVWQLNPNQRVWSARPALLPAAEGDGNAAHGAAPLPDPARDFPELSQDFRLAADALVPGHVAASVALNRDGSRAAVVEHQVSAWVRNGPAIGRWDPPIRVLNFLPRQHGRVRMFDGTGQELLHKRLPEVGSFEVACDPDEPSVWCWPSSWFARGMAGAAWLPVDRPARTIYRVSTGSGPIIGMAFPDAVADCAVSPTTGYAAVSCWDGHVRLVDRDGQSFATVDAGGPARLAWSPDGAFVVAGTANGRLLCFETNGTVPWSQFVPAAEPPASTPPTEVVAGLPIFQGGRIPRGEHAYVGDIWMIITGRTAVLVDAGGVSGFSFTEARLRALGVERVTHVLHTHTHGDHCGGAYLWRSRGAQMVGAKSAAFALTWLMPMLTDYGIYPPRPLDLALPLARVGDATDFEVSGLKFRAIFVPGHSFDLTIYLVELGGRRVAFTGDLGFENQDILHRCWGEADKARAVVRAVREKLLSWAPDIVFTGHGVRPSGTEFIAMLVRRTEDSLKQLPQPTKP